MHRRSAALLLAAGIVVGVTSVSAGAVGDDPNSDKKAAVRGLHDQQSLADPSVDAGVLAAETRRRNLDEQTRSVSPGVYFSADGVPVVRIYAGAVPGEALDMIQDDWPEVQTAASRYSASELDVMRELVAAIPLRGDDAFGADYVAEDDIFRITGTVNPDAVARVLAGHDYELVEGDASRTPRTNDSASPFG